MNNNYLTNWQNALSETYQQVTQHLIDFAPQLLASLFLLLIGWLAATFAAKGTKSLLAMAIAFLGKKIKSIEPGRHSLSHAQIQMSGRLVFWAVMLFFGAASASSMGITVFSEMVSNIISYLPKLFTGLLIIFVGYWLSRLCNTLLANAAVSAGIQEGKIIGGGVQIAVLFTSIVIGAQQLGIDIQFLTELLSIVVGVTLAGCAIAFGLGARLLVANVIGIQQAYKHYQMGDTVQVANTKGVIIEFTTTCVILDTGDGKATIPAALFQDQVVLIKDESGSIKQA